MSSPSNSEPLDARGVKTSSEERKRDIERDKKKERDIEIIDMWKEREKSEKEVWAKEETKRERKRERDRQTDR